MKNIPLIVVCAMLYLGCGDAPQNTDILVHIEPSDISSVTSIYVRASLNKSVAQEPFEFSNKPLDHFWVRMPSSYRGLLVLDISAKASDSCVIWEGTTETRLESSYQQEITAKLMSVVPPKC